MCRLSGNLVASTSWNPQGLSRPVMGELYLYIEYRNDLIGWKIVWMEKMTWWGALCVFCTKYLHVNQIKEEDLFRSCSTHWVEEKCLQFFSRGNTKKRDNLLVTNLDGLGILTLILLTWSIWWTPNNASKWQIGFNSVFKGLTLWPWSWTFTV